MTFSSVARHILVLSIGAIGIVAVPACSGQPAATVPPVSLAERTSQAAPTNTEQAARAAGSPAVPLQLVQSNVATAATESFKFLTAPVVYNENVPSLAVGPDGNLYYPGPSTGGTLPVVVQYQPATGQSSLFSPSQTVAYKLDYTFAGAGNGPNGEIWLGSYSCYLVSMTTAGDFAIHEVAYPSASCAYAETAFGTTIGDRVWFTAQVTADKVLYYVGYFDVTEKKSKVFKVGPISARYCGYQISNIVQGPDGNFWFGDGPYVGRVTPAGSVHLFTSPLASVCQVLSGPDGNIWYLGANSGVDGFGVMGTQGNDIATVLNTTGIFYELTNGPDGNIWVTGTDGLGGENAGIYKISVANQKYKFYPFPKPEDQKILPIDIITGPNNNLWFDTEQRGSGTTPDTHGLGMVVSGR